MTVGGTVERVSVLINPAAGGDRGSKRARSIVAELVEAGCTVDLHRLDGPDQVGGLVDELRANQVRRLILAGGDGLVHLALPALVADRDGESEHERMTVGIVPIGTGNDFCRGLGLPTGQSQAVSAALSDAVSPVDVIAVDHPGRLGSPAMAATVLTCGFSGRVNARANTIRFPPGGRRYTVATVAEMLNLRTDRYRLAFDDEPPVDVDALMIAVGNTRYFGGGMAVCPEARFDDGLLDVVIVDDVSAWTFARVLPGVFSGRHMSHRAVTGRRCRRLSITTTEPLWADGEALAFPPAASPPSPGMAAGAGHRAPGSTGAGDGTGHATTRPGSDRPLQFGVRVIPRRLLIAGIPPQGAAKV